MNEEPRMTLRVTEVMALQDRISALEATNAALREFVKAEDAWNAHAESGDWDGDDGAYLTMMAARQALTEAGFPWSDAQ